MYKLNKILSEIKVTSGFTSKMIIELLKGLLKTPLNGNFVWEILEKYNFDNFDELALEKTYDDKLNQKQKNLLYQDLIKLKNFLNRDLKEIKITDGPTSKVIVELILEIAQSKEGAGQLVYNLLSKKGIKDRMGYEDTYEKLTKIQRNSIYQNLLQLKNTLNKENINEIKIIKNTTPTIIWKEILRISELSHLEVSNFKIKKALDLFREIGWDSKKSTLENYLFNNKIENNKLNRIYQELIKIK